MGFMVLSCFSLVHFVIIQLTLVSLQLELKKTNKKTGLTFLGYIDTRADSDFDTELISLFIIQNNTMNFVDAYICYFDALINTEVLKPVLST